MTSFGQIAFEAYSQSTGGKTYDGRDIPTWDELTERIQQAWEAAAQAIIAQFTGNAEAKE